MVFANTIELPDSSRIPRLKVSAGVQSVRGQRRANNEDKQFISSEKDLFIVADGMGGHSAGELASQFAVDVVSHDLARIDMRIDETEIEKRLQAAMGRAHCMILQAAIDNPARAGAGSTVVVALLRGHRLYVTGVGDSRAYRIRGRDIERLTVDDTWPDTMLAMGQISVDEARRHHMRNLLISALGLGDFDADSEEIRVLDVYHGDRYLLASDGLTDNVQQQRLAEIIEQNLNPQTAAERLVDEAIAQGGGDDITCIVFDVQCESGATGRSQFGQSWWRRLASKLLPAR